MKKHFLLYVALFAGTADFLSAQIKVNNSVSQKTPMPKVQALNIRSVSNQFVRVHIDTVKPFVVGLKPITFGNNEVDACRYFKSLKPTLVLRAERANDALANLQWQTKYAFYATGFTIERSFADTLHFSTINIATALLGGSFKKNYTSPDYNDYNGFTFYRIRQHNGDTGFIYSNVVAIKGVNAMPLKVYPNPATNRVWIDVAVKQSGKYAVMVYDVSGKILQQQSGYSKQNRQVIQNINVSKLPAGFYEVRVILPDKSSLSGNFVKK